MKNCSKYAPVVLRLVLGVTLVIASIGKLSDPPAFVALVQTMSPWLPEGLSSLYGYALPSVELIVGVLTLVGWQMRIVGWIGALLFASIIVGVSAATPDATFFLEKSGIPNKDFAYLAMMVSLALTGAGMWSLDERCGGKC